MPVFILTFAKWLKLPPWLTAALSILLILGALGGLAKCAVDRHDRGVIAAHEADVTNKVNAEVSAGTNAADAQANVTAARNAEQHNEVQEAISNAVTAHPAEARRSAGPASSAALDRLRHRPR